MVQKMILGDDFLTDGTITIVGRLTIAFGQLDYVLQITVKRHLNKSFGEGMREAERLQTINALRDRAEWQHGRRVMDQKKEAKFMGLMERISDLYKERQAVIHGLWAKDGQGQVVRIWKRKPQSTDLRHLEKLFKSVQRVTLDLNAFTLPEQSR